MRQPHASVPRTHVILVGDNHQGFMGNTFMEIYWMLPWQSIHVKKNGQKHLRIFLRNRNREVIVWVRKGGKHVRFWRIYAFNIFCVVFIDDYPYGNW